MRNWFLEVSVSCVCRRWSWYLSQSIFKRRQGSCSALKLRYTLFFNSCHIAFNCLMLSKISLELISVQVWFQLENFPGNFLILSLDSLQLCLSLIKMQALCSKFDLCDRVTFRERIATCYRVELWFLASRNLNELLQKLLIVTFDFSLLYWLLIVVYALFVTEEAFMVIDCVRNGSRLNISVFAHGDARQLCLMNSLCPNNGKMKQFNIPITSSHLEKGFSILPTYLCNSWFAPT